MHSVWLYSKLILEVPHLFTYVEVSFFEMCLLISIQKKNFQYFVILHPFEVHQHPLATQCSEDNTHISIVVQCSLFFNKHFHGCSYINNKGYVEPSDGAAAQTGHRRYYQHTNCKEEYWAYYSQADFCKRHSRHIKNASHCKYENFFEKNCF